MKASDLSSTFGAEADFKELRMRFALAAPTREIQLILDAGNLERAGYTYSQDFAWARLKWADALIEALVGRKVAK